MQTKTEFIARNATVDQIARKLKADKVIYQSLEDLEKAVSLGNKKLHNFCSACFSGVYPTGDVSPELLAEIESARRIVKDNQLSLDI
jgi:amidophosphoribosyltransferase